MGSCFRKELQSLFRSSWQLLDGAEELAAQGIFCLEFDGLSDLKIWRHVKQHLGRLWMKFNKRCSAWLQDANIVVALAIMCLNYSTSDHVLASRLNSTDIAWYEVATVRIHTQRSSLTGQPGNHRHSPHHLLFSSETSKKVQSARLSNWGHIAFVIF